MKNPLLAELNYTEDRKHYLLRVVGGLNYLRGNSAPYFSITVEQYGIIAGRKHEDCFGCCHDLIAAKFPGRFDDLIALHLSDIDGIPMHFEGNGWYDLAGALDGAGERYHVGNSERHFPIVPDPATPWKNTEYRHPTATECLQIFADHCRIPILEAAEIAAEVKAAFGPITEELGLTPWRKSDYTRGREVWRKLSAVMLPRFKREADACIARHNLKVYGDEWKGKA